MAAVAVAITVPTSLRRLAAAAPIALLLVAAIAPAPAEAQAPAFAGATLVGGGGDDAPYRVTALAGGEAIIAGRFTSRARFGRRVVSTSAGRDAAFVARMRPDGSFAWATALAGTGHDIGLAVLPDGSSYVVGDFRRSVRIGASTLRSQGSYDVFVARLDERGRVLWARRAGGWLTDAARGVAVRADGSAVITGRFRGTAEFGRRSITSRGGTDAFVAAVTPDGTFAWVRRLGGPGDDSANGITTRADGSIVAVGRFTRRVELGGRALTSAGRADALVAALDPRGRVAWAIGIGGPGDDTALGLDARGRGTAIVGAFAGTAQAGARSLVGTGATSGFAAEVDDRGRVRWATAIAGSGPIALRAASRTRDGALLVAGRLRGEAAIGPSTLASAGRDDALVALLDADGRALWGLAAGGPGDDLGLDVAATREGALLVGRADPGAAFGPATPAGLGGGDIAIATIAAPPGG